MTALLSFHTRSLRANAKQSSFFSFKAIYTSKTNFSPEQKEIIDNLIGQLRSDENKDAKGRTLEEQYAYKGKDFLFKQSEKDEYSGFAHACKLVLGGLAFALACIYGPKCCSNNNKPIQEQVTKTITVAKDSITKELPKDTLSLLKK